VTLRRLWREHPVARAGVLAATALEGASAVSWLAILMVLSVVVDRAFLSSSGSPAVSGLLTLMIGLAVLQGALLLSSGYVGQRSANRLKRDLRRGLVASLCELGPVFARRERAGALVHTAGDGVETIDELVARAVPTRALAIVIPTLVALMVAAIDPWSVLVLLFAGPVLLILMALIGARVRERAERRERDLAWVQAHVLDALRGLPTIRMFGRGAHEAETMEAISDRYGTTTLDVLRTAFQTTLVLEWGATAAIAMIAVETGVRVMSGSLPFGRAFAVLLLAPEFFAPLRRSAGVYHAAAAGTVGVARIHAIADEPPPTLPRPSHPVDVPAELSIGFEDVRLAFEDGSRVALDGCSFEVGEGERVWITGPSGSGKTSIANLLLRFADPDGGRITVGGVPLDRIDRDAWRGRIGYVPQHPWLFHGTVAENLRLADPTASDAALERAAEAASIHGLVRSLPHGYDTPIGEAGVRLSGGERQRLAIARAFLRDPPVLILDEATAHLDDESRAAVLDAVDRLTTGRTALVIAHRPHEHADRIVRLRAGRVVAQTVQPETSAVGSGDGQARGGRA
jgi:ATP-binding cassette, subfamily C, bacterial CydD